MGLTASAGVAPNKFVAKVASDLEKPDGLVVVMPDGIQAFLDPLPVSSVWGIGAQTQKRLESCGVHTIAQLRQLSHEVLKSAFGINSDHFWRLARGLDTRPVIPDREAKSISHETTFQHDLSDCELLRAWLLDLTDQVARRMRWHKIVGRTVQLKIRYSNFETLIRSRTLDEPTNSTDALARVACSNGAAGSATNQANDHSVGNLFPKMLSGRTSSKCSEVAPLVNFLNRSTL